MAQNGVITIKFVEGSNKTPGPQPINTEPGGTTTETVTASVGEVALQSAVILGMAKKAAETIKNTTIDQAKYQLNRYFTITDNYMAQQNMNIALGVINKTVSFGTAVVGGAIAGSAAGPGGAIAGAVIAASTQALSVGIDIYRNYSEENLKLRQMDASLEFNRQRAGYSLTAGTRGENR